MTYVCKKFASFHQLKFSTDVDVDQEWKLPILHELLKVKEDNMFRLETIFVYYTLFLFLSYHIVPFYLCVRNKSIIIIKRPLYSRERLCDLKIIFYILENDI